MVFFFSPERYLRNKLTSFIVMAIILVFLVIIIAFFTDGMKHGKKEKLLHSRSELQRIRSDILSAADKNLIYDEFLHQYGGPVSAAAYSHLLTMHGRGQLVNISDERLDTILNLYN